MQILYDNQAFNATINALTENPSYPFSTAIGSNTQTQLSRVGRTIDVTSQYIDFSFGSATGVQYVAILGHNITSSATISIQGGTALGGNTFSQSITTEYRGVWIVAFTNVESYQYWRLNISDATNPDGYIEIGAVFLGTSLEMPGMNLGQVVSTESASVASPSASGQVYGDRRLNYDIAEIVFIDITESKRQEIKTWISTVDIVQPFVLLIWENDLDVQGPVYSVLTETPQLARSTVPGSNLWGLTMKVREAF